MEYNIPYFETSSKLNINIKEGIERISNDAYEYAKSSDLNSLLLEKNSSKSKNIFEGINDKSQNNEEKENKDLNQNEEKKNINENKIIQIFQDYNKFQKLKKYISI